MFFLKTSWVASFLGIVLVSTPSFNRQGDRVLAIETNNLGNVTEGLSIVNPETSLTSGVLLGRSLQYRSWNDTGKPDISNVPWELASKKIAWDRSSERAFCPPVSQETEQWSQLPKVPNINLPKPHFSALHLRGRLAKVVQNIFDWPEPDLDRDRSVPVVTIDPPISPQPKSFGSSTHLVNVWYSPTSQISPSQISPEEYRILIDGKVAIALTNPKQIKLIASRLQQVLADTDFDPNLIKPAILGKYPAAMMGDRLLFVADSSFVLNDDENIELALINWVNTLRTALGVEPLRLVNAQEQMYRITETSQEFQGTASWYGPYFHGRLTANGEIYDQEAFTAAHPYLPFNTYLKVTNLENQETIIVRINDRGPYIYPRTLDLSRGVARCLQSKKSGVIPYRAVIMTDL
ncbi:MULTISPECIES: septal ring lytic transglycosylase RlpA family protein [Spirulina sp. CCY15215]|uniref:septal ring lytic transglycosylase RlpA family protein n=1 Tax=Spirulina sp. CCY15215 TaxID=2767591 RepID=UPI00195180FE|nr:septal ring lytic transglycosylase RlpA family protein [Spirulina major]